MPLPALIPLLTKVATGVAIAGGIKEGIDQIQGRNVSDQSGILINPGAALPGGQPFITRGVPMSQMGRRRRRRRRLLTQSDKADIAALKGILGEGTAFKSAVGGLLARRF